MKTKKVEARFTIQFNLDNPRHKEAVQILNEAGRGKAVLIADALYVYSRYVANAIDNIGNNKSVLVQHEVTPTTHEKFEVSEIVSLTTTTKPTNTATNHSTEGDVWQTVNESLEAFFD